MDESKIKLMIAELQDIQSKYTKDSSVARWIRDSVFSLDGAACSIATLKIEKASDVR